MLAAEVLPTCAMLKYRRSGAIPAAWATPAPKETLLYFIYPHNGAKIKGAF